MKKEERRKGILELLGERKQPITGGDLATIFKVSRQVIVQDVALLRAEGHEILATPQGYFLVGADRGGVQRKTLAVTHGPNELEQELNIIVDNGGRVVDVTVEHPLYGELKGFLMISSRQDVQAFLKELKKSGAAPLSLLTHGIHLHTVEALSQEALANIQKELEKAGYLVK